MGFATGFLDHPKLSNVHLSQGDEHAEAQQSDLIFPEQGDINSIWILGEY